MKKINSNAYGGKWILTGLSMIALSFGVKLVGKALVLSVPSFVIQAPLILGTVILLGFGLLLAVEFRQDKMINANYHKIRRTKVAIGNGRCECQSCGYPHVLQGDKTCPVCGIRFDNDPMVL